MACHAGTVRPALKPGLLPVWRDRDTLQIGIDSRRAVALTGMAGAASVIGLLDGSRDRAQVIQAAVDEGIPGEVADRVLDLLAVAGALDDFPAATLRLLSRPLRARLAAELATVSLANGDGDGGARTLARRLSAQVRIHGGGRVADGIAGLLATAGVGRVVPDEDQPGAAGGRDDPRHGPQRPASERPQPGAAGRRDDPRSGPQRPGPERPQPKRSEPKRTAPERSGPKRTAPERSGPKRTAPERPAPKRVGPKRTGQEPARPEQPATARAPERPDLAILVGRHSLELRAALMRTQVPHLAASADEAIGVVGPLVIPGRSACLTCLDLTRTDRDPAWPLILAQLTDRRPDPLACDAPLAAAVAAQAAAQALAFIDRAAAAGAVTDGTLELVLPGWQWRRRTWPRHSECSCRC
jgi:hypothetical protein